MTGLGPGKGNKAGHETEFGGSLARKRASKRAMKRDLAGLGTEKGLKPGQSDGGLIREMSEIMNIFATQTSKRGKCPNV